DGGSRTPGRPADRPGPLRSGEGEAERPAGDQAARRDRGRRRHRRLSARGGGGLPAPRPAGRRRRECPVPDTRNRGARLEAPNRLFRLDFRDTARPLILRRRTRGPGTRLRAGGEGPMLRNYLVTALRNIMRNKLYAGI